MNFKDLKVGQKIRCIKDLASGGNLKIGNIYTINELGEFYNNMNGGINICGLGTFWRVDRFEKVSTDYTYGQLLEKIDAKI